MSRASSGLRARSTGRYVNQHAYEIRCYIRDPDGHLIEVGQTTDPDGDWTPAHWASSTPAEESE